MEIQLFLLIVVLFVVRQALKAKVDTYLPAKDQRTWNDVQHHAHMHKVFNAYFDGRDVVYKSALARLSNNPTLPERIVEVDKSLQQVTSELRQLDRDITDFTIDSKNNRRLEEGYAKEQAEYYRAEWKKLQKAISSRMKVIQTQLQQLRTDVQIQQ